MIEQNLIGCILNKNSIIVDIIDIVKPNDFTNNDARRIYKLCIDFWRADKNIDIVVALAELKDINPAWLAESSMFQNMRMATVYAGQIAETAKRERINKSVTEAISDKMNTSSDVINLISNIVLEDASCDSDIADSASCVDEFGEMLKSGGLKGYSSGYKILDSLDIKLIRGDYWVVGASTSVGKTSFALNIFCHLLLSGDVKICMVSTEMTRLQIISRLVAYFTNIAGIKIIKGNAHASEQEKIQKSLTWLKTKLFFISEKTFEITSIENKVRSLNLKHGLDVVFIDYIQHCRSTDYSDKYASLTNISGRLQELGKVAGVCCIALSQLSNDYGKNGGSLEFKGSGDIAGDCDVGIILKKRKPRDPILKISVKKNRHGPLGSGHLKYNPNYSKLEDFN